jgi:hypothetical protein
MRGIGISIIQSPENEAKHVARGRDATFDAGDRIDDIGRRAVKSDAPLVQQDDA